MKETGLRNSAHGADKFGLKNLAAVHWNLPDTILTEHAIANGCYVAVPNRVGLETPVGGDGIQFWGQSFICDPQGQIVAKASSKEEEILCVEIDLRRVEEQRTHWPFLRDRRTDAYGDITKRLID